MRPAIWIPGDESKMTCESPVIATLDGHAEQIWITFVETDIELAFSFLRLAEAESGMGNGSRAGALIEKAILGYKDVIKRLESVSVVGPADLTDVRERASALLEAIVSVEQRFRLLCG